MSIRGLRIARDIARHIAAAGAEILHRARGAAGAQLNSDEDLADYACRSAKTDHHPVGTCNMGVDAMAVVSPDLRLRGIEGLRACAASVMLRVPSSNTNAPTVMVGEKGADLIRGGEPLPPTVFSGDQAAA